MSGATLATTGELRPRTLTAWIDGFGDVRQLEVLRIAIGPIVVLHLWPFLQLSLDGIAYSDRFVAPYTAWYPEAPRELYFVHQRSARHVHEDGAPGHRCECCRVEEMVGLRRRRGREHDGVRA